MISNIEVIARLVLSAAIGGMIGVEREVHNRPAGLRTHILVSLGSALIMLISMYGFNTGDPGRLAAQVVTGVGFLGAGTIMKTGNDIKGLTTAASLWISSGIGLSIGNGYYMGGIVTGAIVMITLMSLRRIEKKIVKKNSTLLEITGMRRVGLIGEIGTYLGKCNISIEDIKIISQEAYEGEDVKFMEIHIILKPCSKKNLEYVFDGIFEIEGITSIIYEGNKLNHMYCN